MLRLRFAALRASFSHEKDERFLEFLSVVENVKKVCESSCNVALVDRP